MAKPWLRIRIATPRQPAPPLSGATLTEVRFGRGERPSPAMVISR